MLIIEPRHKGPRISFSLQWLSDNGDWSKFCETAEWEPWCAQWIDMADEVSIPLHKAFRYGVPVTVFPHINPT